MGVNIRQNKLKNNRCSLSLDIYFQGKPHYEGLGIFIYEKATTALEKEHNKRTLALAESIKAKRILEMQESHFNIHTGFRSQGSLLEYFKIQVKKRRKNEGSYGSWSSACKHFEKFCNGKQVKFSNCDERFIERYKEYLKDGKITKGKKQLSNNTAMSYLNLLKATLTQAFNDRIILDNPGKRVKGITEVQKAREFLLEEELQILAKTPCENPLLKDAFLFSCLTGLRWSDVYKLTWGEISYSEAEKRWKIYFTQRKTKGLQFNPIPDNAYKLLGERKGSQDRVFEGLVYSSWNNHLLREWVWKDAGIKKKITFHKGRHTFATLLISSGADIYSVCDFLGHKNVRTTEIYAKITSPQKNKIIDLLPNIDI